MFSLGTRDFLRGLILAGLVPAIVIIQQSITAGTIVFDWPLIWKAALAGFIGYLLKNFLTDDTQTAIKTLAKQDVTIIDNKTATVVTDGETIKENIPK